MRIIPNNWKIIDLLKLSYFKGLSPSLLKKIAEDYPSYDEFINAELPPNLNLIINQGELFKRRQIKPEVEAQKQLEVCEKEHINILTIWDPDYPSLLKEIHQAPAFLFYKGRVKNENSNYLSIVGTRKCSNYGKINTRRFSNYFAAKGTVIVSGLAYGIDTEAHIGAIEQGGKTYAIIASGIDKLGPQTALKNAEKIIDSGGAVISMYRCGVKALPPFFLQRNRIISGISLATLIIESKIKGGSLNTARFARDQNREVFALPGNITSINSDGTNQLIRNGLARLTTSPEELYLDLGYDSSKTISISELPELNFANEEDKIVYFALSFEPIHIDELAEKVSLDMSQLLVSLLNLEFAGHIKQIPGKYYIRS